MRFLAVSYKGMEDITALEIKETLGVEPEVKESCVVFESDDVSDYIKNARGVNKILILYDEFKIKNLEDLSRIKELDIQIKGNFAARSWIVENEMDNSEVQKATGDLIEGDVDLKNPGTTVFVYIYKDDCYVGVDISGDMSKRDYKIVIARNELKGTIAYSLVRMSGIDEGGILVDPFCSTGAVVIEAALFGAKAYGFDSRVRGAEQNASAAGVRKKVHLKEDGMDLFKDDEVDTIVSNVPRMTKLSKGIEARYKELFSDAKNVLKGKMVLCSNDTSRLKEIAAEDGFSVEEERELKHGEETLKIVTIGKS